MPSGNLDPSVCSKKLTPPCLLFIKRLFGHHHAVVINESKVLGVFIASRNHLNRTSSVHTYCPLGNIKHVSAPICRKSAPCFLIPSPCSPDFFVLRRIQRDRW